jgi:pectinesterase
MRYLLALSSFVSAVLAASRTTAPPGAITVGSGGKYSTIQAAINSLSTTSTTAQSLFILAGTYNEQVIIPARMAALTIYGYTEDTTSYKSNVVTISHSSSLLSGAANDKATGTVQNNAASTKFYNINIKNTYGKGSQAIALAAYGDKQGYYGVGLYGYQDTLLAETGNQVYAGGYIEGAVDFIFGQHARIWIDSTAIAVSAPQGAITANGRASSSDVSYYVINKSTVSGSSSTTATAGSVFLGRPWSQYARVCFQNTNLGSIINSAGWEVWSASEPNTEDVVFQEYGNTGAGASGTRASFSSKLSAPVSISTILGSGYTDWVDSTYLS